MTDATNSVGVLLVAWLSGSLLGAAFYGGLWWTVRHGVSSPRPTLWFVGSLALRTGMALAGIYLVGGGQWERLTSCLLGFVMARPLVMWLTATFSARIDTPIDTPVDDGPESRTAPPCTSRPT